jgi:hypothetical protein
VLDKAAETALLEIGDCHETGAFLTTEIRDQIQTITDQ